MPFLLPYDPAVYSLRASGIFVEAIAAARPVLVTAKTWMDRELVNWGRPGVRTRDWTIESLVEGILQLADELPIRKELARRVAPIFRAKFTAESFLSAFSSLAVKG
jgi:glycosyltransferase involved in cell wall biosynthesis